MAIRELPFTVDTRIDSELSGVNQRLRHLTKRKRPLEPRHIVDFDVIAKPDDRTVTIRLTYDDSVFKVDQSTPANGKTFDRDSAPRKMSMVMSNPIDSSTGVFSPEVTYNGLAVPVANLSVSKRYILEVDLGSLTGAHDPSPATGDGIHSLQIDSLLDVDGNNVQSSEITSWAVEDNTVNIDPGEPTPYTRDLKYGTYKVSRLVMTRGTNIQDQLDRFLKDKGIKRDQILKQDLVTSFSSVLELYILYFDRLYPQLIKIFPNEGSVNTVGAAPDRLVFTFSSRLDTGCMANSGNFLIDNSGIDSGSITFSPDAKTVFLDPSSVLSGQDTGVHNVCISSICSPDGSTYPGPPIGVSFALAHISTGGSSTGVSGPDVDPYLALTGGTIDGNLVVNTGITVDGGVSVPSGNVVVTGLDIGDSNLVHVSAVPGANYGLYLPTGAPQPNQLMLFDGNGQGTFIDNTSQATVTAAFDTFFVPNGTNPTAIGQDTLTGAVDGPITMSGDQGTNTVTFGLNTGLIDHDDLAGVDTGRHFLISDVTWDQMDGIDPSVSLTTGGIPYFDGPAGVVALPTGAANTFMASNSSGHPSWRDLVSSDIPGYDTHTGNTGTHFEQGDIDTVGTITGGTWNGSVLDSQYGGTSTNNSGNSLVYNNDVTINVSASPTTITLTGDFTTTGAVTLNPADGGSIVNLPDTGTLVTRDDNVTLLNKSIDGNNNNITNIPETGIINGSTYARMADNEIITGDWTFNGDVVFTGTSVGVYSDAGITFHDNSGSMINIAVPDGITEPGGYTITIPPAAPAEGNALVFTGGEFSWGSPNATIDAFKIFQYPAGSDSTASGEDTLVIQTESGIEFSGGVGNTLVVSIKTDELVHQELSGAGTITHATLDSLYVDYNIHVGATNPHGVTTGQIGAPDVADFTAHTGNLSNPHVVTIEQVGGTPTGDFTAHVGLFDSHTGDLTNPHAVTVLQIGGTPTGDWAIHTGATNPHGLTIADLGAATGATYDAHIASTNPHAVTTGQIGAPDVADFIAHTGNLNNPHGVTLAQINGATGSDIDDHLIGASISHTNLSQLYVDYNIHAAASNPHSITLSLLGGATGATFDAHESATNPHGLALSDINGATGSTHDAHVAASNPHGITLATLGAATGATFDAHTVASNPHSITTTMIGAATGSTFNTHLKTTNPHNITAVMIGAATGSTFDAHTAADNPHSVTTGQIGAPDVADFIAHTGDSSLHLSADVLDDYVPLTGDSIITGPIEIIYPYAGASHLKISDNNIGTTGNAFEVYGFLGKILHVNASINAAANGITTNTSIKLANNSFTNSGSITINSLTDTNVDYIMPQYGGDILGVDTGDAASGQAVVYNPDGESYVSRVTTLNEDNYFLQIAGATAATGNSSLIFGLGTSYAALFHMKHHHDASVAANRQLSINHGTNTGMIFKGTTVPTIEIHADTDFQDSVVHGVGTPTATGDVASKGYVDDTIAITYHTQQANLWTLTAGTYTESMQMPAGGIVTSVRVYQGGVPAGSNTYNAYVGGTAAAGSNISGTNNTWVVAETNLSFHSGDDLRFRRVSGTSAHDYVSMQVDYQITG